MNRLLLVSLLLLSLNGCKRLLNRDDSTAPEKVLDTAPALGKVPSFNIPIAAGYARSVFHGQLKAPPVVVVDEVPGSFIRVFIKDNAGWFKIGNAYSDTYWYSRVANKITYHNAYANQEYCIYQDEPLQQA